MAPLLHYRTAVTSVRPIDVNAFCALGGEGDRARTLLAADHPTRRRCEVELFGAEGHGRVAAIVNPRLVDDEHRPYGLLALFRCDDDQPAAAALLDAACAWLRERGCATARGPMCFTTWHDYRFMTGGFGAGAMPGEPYHPRYYPKLWREAGFRECATYSTNWLGEPEAVADKFATVTRRALDRGYSVRGLGATDLPTLYKLSTEAFADAYMYSRIDPDEFAALYSADDVPAAARTSYLAHAPNGDAIGFLYAFPCTLAGRKALVCKTIAVRPGGRSRGLYPLLMHTWIRDGIADGYRDFVGGLMHVEGTPANLGWTSPDTRIKEYALYERAL